MIRRQTILILIISLFILFLIPKAARAEIATVRDWIGVFDITVTDNTKNKTVPSIDTTHCPDSFAWVYTSSCNQTPGTIPKLADPTGCNFSLLNTISIIPGHSYQFRLYANDYNPIDDPADSSALIASSKAFKAEQTPIPVPITGKVYYIKNGDLNINDDITANITGIVFIDGNLNIRHNLTSSINNAGLVFVVQRDINIDSTVTQIDAVLISQGHIYTAADTTVSPIGTCTHTNPVTTQQLTINGSLVSLSSDNNIGIEFCRRLTDNTTEPAEIIVQQPKYLVILRSLYSETLQRWSELP